MSVSKILALFVYAILAALVLLLGDSPAGVWALRIILILVVAHAVEVMIFFRVCQRAGGSLPAHLLNVFFFGILHVKEIKGAATAS